MKTHYPWAAFLLAATLTTACACSDDNDSQQKEETETVPGTPTAEFAKNDGSKALTGTPQQCVQSLLQRVGSKVADGIGSIQIKDDERAEINQFTQNLVKGCKTEAEKYQKIFDYVKKLEYKHEYEGGNVISNDPYPVFKTHTAICQGFANLQHVMLESQGIPTLNVNGQLVGVGGHAWNYVYYDGKWWVSDPTNADYIKDYPGTFPMDQPNGYKHLEPSSIDAPIFANDEIVVNFKDYELNIDEVKYTGTQFIVPFGVEGFRITSMSPTKQVPEQVKEIYLSQNIRTLGEYYKGLEKNAPAVTACYVDPHNAHLAGEGGAIYRRNGREYQMYYLPAQLQKLTLKPMKIVDKNVVFDHQGIQEVTIATGTQEISDYAFEKCPNLKVAYIPAGVKVAKKAFYQVHPDFKIVKK